MTNCGDIKILINKDLDSRLNPEERQALYRHLDLCPACAADYQEFHSLDALLRQRIGAVEPPAGFVDAVMQALPGQGLPQPATALKPRRKRNRWLTLVAVAAGLLLATIWSGVFDPAEQPALTPPPQVAEDPDQNGPLAPPVAQPDKEAPIVAEDDPPQDPATEETPDQPDDTGSQPEAADPPSAPQTYNNGIPLPAVAGGEAGQGEYSLFTLASYQDYDALLPRISNNTVTYYVNADGVYLEYQVPLDDSQARVFQGETESLPTAAGICGFTDESAAHDYSYITALSPDGLHLAINQGGDQPGLYLQAAQGGEAPVQAGSQGGGKLVCWAPDGNKVLFTDGDGNLHLYYLAEKISLPLYSGKVSSVCWPESSNIVVFAGGDPATGHSAIFRVSVP